MIPSPFGSHAHCPSSRQEPVTAPGSAEARGGKRSSQNSLKRSDPEGILRDCHQPPFPLFSEPENMLTNLSEQSVHITAATRSSGQSLLVTSHPTNFLWIQRVLLLNSSMIASHVDAQILARCSTRCSCATTYLSFARVRYHDSIVIRIDVGFDHFVVIFNCGTCVSDEPGPECEAEDTAVGESDRDYMLLGLDESRTD